VNFDGTDAACGFSLPRLELHSGADGWTSVCYLENGTSAQQPLRTLTTTPAKRAAAAAALITLGPRYAAELLALLHPATRRPMT